MNPLNSKASGDGPAGGADEASATTSVRSASTMGGGMTKLQKAMLDRMIERKFSDDEVETAFNAMSFGRNEISAQDLIRFYSAIGEDINEDEARTLVAAISSNGSTVDISDFKKLQDPRATTSVADPPGTVEKKT